MSNELDSKSDVVGKRRRVKPKKLTIDLPLPGPSTGGARRTVKPKKLSIDTDVAQGTVTIGITPTPGAVQEAASSRNEVNLQQSGPNFVTPSYSNIPQTFFSSSPLIQNTQPSHHTIVGLLPSNITPSPFHHHRPMGSSSVPSEIVNLPTPTYNINKKTKRDDSTISLGKKRVIATSSKASTSTDGKTASTTVHGPTPDKVTIQQPSNPPVKTADKVTIQQPSNPPVTTTDKVTIKQPSNPPLKTADKVTIKQPSNTQVKTADKVTIKEPSNTQVKTADKVTIQQPSNPQVKTADKVTIQQPSNTQVKSTDKVAIQQSSTPQVKTADEFTIQQSSNHPGKTTDKVAIQQPSTPKVKTTDKVAIQQSSTPKVKTADKVTIKQPSNPQVKTKVATVGQRKSVQSLQHDPSIHPDDDKEVLNNTNQAPKIHPRKRRADIPSLDSIYRQEHVLLFSVSR